jgi:hypothetical protein
MRQAKRLNEFLEKPRRVFFEGVRNAACGFSRRNDKEARKSER